MKISEYITESGNDFTAILVCEHCGETQKLTTGYHDNYYHTKVIPAITCKHCFRRRDGEIPVEPNPQGRRSV